MIVTTNGLASPTFGHQSELLLRLAASPGVVPDEAVMEWFWPDGNPTDARRRLRNLLNRLSSQCGGVVIRRGRSIGLHPSIRVDFRVFHQLAGAAFTPGTQDHLRTLAARTALELSANNFAELHAYDDWALEIRSEIELARADLQELADRKW